MKYVVEAVLRILEYTDDSVEGMDTLEEAEKLLNRANIGIDIALEGSKVVIVRET